MLSHQTGGAIAERRSSRRIQSLSPCTSPSPPHTAYLPVELRVYILNYVEKCDLKSVRLVSKEWYLLATTHLFDNVSISPRPKDIEVFERITRHPVLSSAVKDLVYDASQFPLYDDIEDYRGKLYYPILRISMRGGDPILKISDIEIKRYARGQLAKVRGGLSYSEFCQMHENDEFVVEGFEKHSAHAKYEQHSFQSGVFYSDICSGLYRLHNLHSVKLSDSPWDHDIDQTPDESSPLMRSWNPYYLHPTLHSEEFDENFSEMADHFHTLTRAISMTGKNITNFELPFNIGPAFPPRRCGGRLRRLIWGNTCRTPILV